MGAPGVCTAAGRAGNGLVDPRRSGLALRIARAPGVRFRRQFGTRLGRHLRRSNRYRTVLSRGIYRRQRGPTDGLGLAQGGNGITGHLGLVDLNFASNGIQSLVRAAFKTVGGRSAREGSGRGQVGLFVGANLPVPRPKFRKALTIMVFKCLASFIF